ncbi:MAG TPA: ABC transporter permease [Trueperaceae bacterium]|nr:ABC transporter permease [Trueperaceae bacterium]
MGEKGGVALSPLIAAQLATAPQPVQLVQRPTSARQLDMVTYYAAGMAVFFVFFIVQMGVAGLLDEEKDGTMTRLLVAPIERRSIIGGKVLGSIVIGVLSLLVLWGASTAIMGAKWGQPVGVLLLIVSVVAAAAGVLMAVAGVARSAEAAGNMQAIVAVVLGALGGVFVPLPEGGGVLSYLSRLSPHYWFLRGLGDLAGTGSPAGVLIDVAAILAFAALAGGIGWALMGRRLDR